MKEEEINKIDLEIEAIELQVIFHTCYGTYWEETQNIKAYLKHLTEKLLRERETEIRQWLIDEGYELLSEKL